MRHVISFLLLLSVAIPSDADRRGMLFSKKGNAAPSSSLDTTLTAYWKMDEASGTRADSGSGSQTLTDNNTVASAAGKISNAGDFEVGNTEYLSHADSATLSLGADTDFTISAWVNLESKATYMGIVAKGDGSGNGDEYNLFYDTSVDRFKLIVGNGAANQPVTANTLGSPALATWYHIVAWHDSTANKIYISVNDQVTPDEAAWAGNTQDTGSVFQIGAYPGPNFYWDGLIDEVGFWKRALTASERTELYGAGSGKTCCPF